MSDMVQIFHCICKSGFNLKEIRMKKDVVCGVLEVRPLSREEGSVLEN